jgi:hypothetical protein
MSQRKAAILRGEVPPGLTPEQAARHAAHYRRYERSKGKPSNPRPTEDPALAGNRVAALANWLGFDPCRGCEDRRQWLNKAHRWLRNGWARLTAHGTLAIVTCHFNPAGYPRLAENYRIFRDALGGLPLFTAEASFDGTFISDGPVRIEATEANILWQKERLLNLVVEALPAKYDRVAWLDADVVFRRPDWYEVASKLLDECAVEGRRAPVVQRAVSPAAGGVVEVRDDRRQRAPTSGREDRDVPPPVPERIDGREEALSSGRRREHPVR